MSYLDNNGLLVVWNNVKQLVSMHRATVTPSVESGTEIAEIDGTTIYAPPIHSSLQITLNSSSWVNNEITINVSGVTATNDVIVTPSPSSIYTWSSCQVYCSSQSLDSLTFSCLIVPEVNLTANILIFL